MGTSGGGGGDAGGGGGGGLENEATIIFVHNLQIFLCLLSLWGLCRAEMPVRRYGLCHKDRKLSINTTVYALQLTA